MKPKQKTISLLSTLPEKYTEELGMYNQQMKFVVEPGIFDVWMRWDSSEELHGTFELIDK